jgi:hypothetical protein
MRDVSDKVVDKVKTHFIFNNGFPKIVPLEDNMEENGRGSGHR